MTDECRYTAAFQDEDGIDVRKFEFIDDAENWLDERALAVYADEWDITGNAPYKWRGAFLVFEAKGHYEKVDGTIVELRGWIEDKVE